MTTQRKRIGATRAVLGRDWIEGGKDYQDAEWDRLRARWHADLLAGSWWLCGDPKETTEYDEQERMVRLHIQAVAKREVGDVFTAPVGTQPGESGWECIGHIVDTTWQAYKGPPAGRDRFA